MGAVRWVVVVVLAVTVCYVGKKVCEIPPMPEFDHRPWWGDGDPSDDNADIRHFLINIPQHDVDDLKARLALPLRIAPSLLNTNFTYGFNSETLNTILKYWQNDYDWRKRERRLNMFSHYKTRVEGLDIHFVRVMPKSSAGKTVRPLLLLHGWPGSFVEFYDVIPLLTTPRDDSDFIFEVICPSLPGYGFSQPAAKQGLSTAEMAQLFVTLMARLGHKKFYVEGGDWGSNIATNIATLFPHRVLGLHVSLVVVTTPRVLLSALLGAVLPSGSVVAPEEEVFLYPQKEFYSKFIRETGYFHLQSTKPDTVGVALNTSPQGLAAYILEKFSSWTNSNNVNKPDGGLLEPDFPISMDAMLDNICIYWFTGSITSSMRLLAETMKVDSKVRTLMRIPTNVPAGLAAYPHDIMVTPRRLAALKYTNIRTFTVLNKGGHFSAMEEPHVHANEMFKFVEAVEHQQQ